MFKTKGLVAVTKYQQVGWRQIIVENWDDLILLFNETCSYTSNFDFE